MHLQTEVNNWTDALPRLPDGVLVKAVDRADLLRTAKQIKPGCITLLRHWYDQGQHYDNAPYAVKLDRARNFFNSFLDGTFYAQYSPYVDIIAGWNEVWAESQTAQEKADRVEQEIAMIQIFKTEHAPRLPAHVRYAMASSAVGNAQPREMYQLAVQEDCYLSDHPYSHWVRGVRSAGDWPNLSGLWNRKEIEYGIKPRYVFDEGGPFESAVDGWRSNKCLGGSVSAYVGAVRTWIQDVKQTAAYKEGRIVGPVALFTTGRQSSTWSTYWTEQPELNALADMFRAEWKPGTVPPSGGLNEALIARSLELQCISLNAAASIQAKIVRDGRQPVGSEGRMTHQGVSYALQPAESLTSQGRWVYYCRVGDWSNVKVITG